MTSMRINTLHLIGLILPYNVVDLLKPDSEWDSDMNAQRGNIIRRKMYNKHNTNLKRPRLQWGGCVPGQSPASGAD